MRAFRWAAAAVILAAAGAAAAADVAGDAGGMVVGAIDSLPVEGEVEWVIVSEGGDEDGPVPVSDGNGDLPPPPLRDDNSTLLPPPPPHDGDVPPPPRDENGTLLPPPPPHDGDAPPPPRDENGTLLPPPLPHDGDVPPPPRDENGTLLPPPPPSDDDKNMTILPVPDAKPDAASPKSPKSSTSAKSPKSPKSSTTGKAVPSPDNKDRLLPGVPTPTDLVAPAVGVNAHASEPQTGGHADSRPALSTAVIAGGAGVATLVVALVAVGVRKLVQRKRGSKLERFLSVNSIKDTDDLHLLVNWTPESESIPEWGHA